MWAVAQHSAWFIWAEVIRYFAFGYQKIKAASLNYKPTRIATSRIANHGLDGRSFRVSITCTPQGKSQRGCLYTLCKDECKKLKSIASKRLVPSGLFSLLIAQEALHSWVDFNHYLLESLFCNVAITTRREPYLRNVLMRGINEGLDIT